MVAIVQSGRFASAFTPPTWAQAWHNAYQTGLSGGGQAHVAFFGDSVTAGFYGSTPYYSASWVAQVAAALDAASGYASGTGMVNAVEKVDLSDARFGGSGFASGGDTGGYYGYRLQSSTTGGTLTFTATCTSFRISFLTGPGFATFPISVDGGTVQNVSANTAGYGQGYATIDAGSLGSHTLTVGTPGGGNFVFVSGVEAVRSPLNGVKTTRMARSGSSTVRFINNSVGFNSRAFMDALEPDLAVLVFGLNDALDAIGTSAFSTNLTTAVGLWAGSKLLVVPPPPSTALIAGATWTAYADVIRERAATLGTGLLDFTDQWVSYAASSAYYHDTVHPNATGAGAMSTAVQEVIMTEALGL